jgi:hypothetical protein
MAQANSDNAGVNATLDRFFSVLNPNSSAGTYKNVNILMNDVFCPVGGGYPWVGIANHGPQFRGADVRGLYEQIFTSFPDGFTRMTPGSLRRLASRRPWSGRCNSPGSKMLNGTLCLFRLSSPWAAKPRRTCHHSRFSSSARKIQREYRKSHSIWIDITRCGMFNRRKRMTSTRIFACS